MPTNPVVVRRVTAMLGKAGLVGATRGLADPPPDTFQLDAVLRAVDGRTKLGVPSPPRMRPPQRGYRPFRLKD
jgi:DNA-binding IscR family transcriptional regulator